MPSGSAMHPSGVSIQLRQLIYYHLDNGFYQNAFFLAGRLYALDTRNPDYVHLLALCNLRLCRYKAVFDLTKPKLHQPNHLACMYVFAQACLALGRYDQGAQALLKVRSQWAGRNHWNKHSETSRRHIPDAAACYTLLGKLYNAHGNAKKANECFTEALKVNPFMWDAFTELCHLGSFVRPGNIFKITPEMLAVLSHSTSNGMLPPQFASQENSETKNPFVSTPEVDPFSSSTRNGADVGLNLGGSNLFSRLNGIAAGPGRTTVATYKEVETPTSSSNQNIHDEDLPLGSINDPNYGNTSDIPQAPLRKTRLQPMGTNDEPPKMRSMTSRVKARMGSEAETTEIARPIGQNGHKRTVSGHSTHQGQTAPSADPAAAPPRRSVRLLNSLNSIRPSSNRLATAPSKEPDGKEKRELRKVRATGTRGKTGSIPQVGRVISGNRKTPVEIPEAPSKPDPRPVSITAPVAAPPPRMAPQSNIREVMESLEWLLGLLRKLATGYAQLSRYSCAEALETFQSIPQPQRDTPWVLSQVGKAYYERSQYPDAENVFSRIREKFPSHLDDMEVYSNALWQMGKETELAHLAHELMDQDRLSPQAWCVTGNAFSMQREHDQAIKSFTRATQLDPYFAYGFTLQGHEHIANEEYDKAMMAYRCAITADKRHYNGWYGLGQVYDKLGKYDIAEQHYRAAANINPTNAILAVKIGFVMDRQGKTEAALQQYRNAVSLDPRSNLARFRKAQAHLKLHRPEDALLDLIHLRDTASDDANVHFLLGRTYKMLGERSHAVRHFTVAINLDPKAQQYIGEVMEAWDEDEEDLEGEGDGEGDGGVGGWSSDEGR
ncbi:TPR-like protein [Westerdykella ornata]|uniref:TPR-like protein n=1 Tax=Westerdykella ornata TaxID=318751 RepID=A0A6A6JUU4_WESOR|nr:TPR-like protein [Westerdykella ornata]KAF2279588.1 TPR-like protein [Westerdykella ornata]